MLAEHSLECFGHSHIVIDDQDRRLERSSGHAGLRMRSSGAEV
jgi:hypothetical protein